MRVPTVLANETYLDGVFAKMRKRESVSIPIPLNLSPDARIKLRIKIKRLAAIASTRYGRTIKARADHLYVHCIRSE